MEIEIEKFEHAPPELNPGPLLGYAKVILQKKMFVWMKVVKGKKGGTFARFPAVKIGEHYNSGFGWLDDPEKEGKISNEVVRILREKGILGSARPGPSAFKEPEQEVQF